MHGMCSKRSIHIRERTPQAMPRDPQERVTTRERDETANLLRAAFADGVLHVEEFDERLARAYGATVYGELQALTSDLPADWTSALERARKAERRATIHRRLWRAELRAYLTVMALLVSIWLLTSAGHAEGFGHPWPIWPALGWGFSLFVTRPRGAVAQAVRNWSLVR